MSHASSPRVFISYAREDFDIAERIVKTLNEIGLVPWIDTTEIRPGDSFIEKMNEGLTKASYVLLLLSQASLSSKWVSREWMATLAEDSSVLLPLLVEDCNVPSLLKDIVYLDLRHDLEKGLEQLISFFKGETDPALPYRAVKGSSAKPKGLQGVSRRHLRLLALRCLTETNLNSFLFDAQMGAGALKGNSLHEKITYLLVDLANQGILAEFADWFNLEPTCGRCIAAGLKELTDETPWSLE